MNLLVLIYLYTEVANIYVNTYLRILEFENQEATFNFRFRGYFRFLIPQKFQVFDFEATFNFRFYGYF